MTDVSLRAISVFPTSRDPFLASWDVGRIRCTRKVALWRLLASKQGFLVFYPHCANVKPKIFWKVPPKNQGIKINCRLVIKVFLFQISCWVKWIFPLSHKHHGVCRHRPQTSTKPPIYSDSRPLPPFMTSFLTPPHPSWDAAIFVISVVMVRRLWPFPIPLYLMLAIKEEKMEVKVILQLRSHLNASERPLCFACCSIQSSCATPAPFSTQPEGFECGLLSASSNVSLSITRRSDSSY